YVSGVHTCSLRVWEVLPEVTFAALEERTLALTRTVRQGWQSFKDLFSATEETVDAAKDAAAALEDLEVASQRQAALSSFMNALLQRLPIVMAALRGAETGAPFGQIGVVAGALIAVAL